MTLKMMNIKNKQTCDCSIGFAFQKVLSHDGKNLDTYLTLRVKSYY